MAKAPREPDEERQGGAGVVMVPTNSDMGLDPADGDDKVVIDTKDDDDGQDDSRPARADAPAGKRVVADIEDTDEEADERRRSREEDARLAYDLGEDDESHERGADSRRIRRNRARRDAVAGRDAEIDQLRSRVEHLTSTLNGVTRGQVGITLNNIDSQLGAAQQALDLCSAEIGKAITAGDGARVQQLLQMRDEAQSRLYTLGSSRQRLIAETQYQERQRGQMGQERGAPAQPTQERPDPRAAEFLDRFMARFDYFNPDGSDEDSAIMKAIDDTVARDGYVPNTRQYWVELEARLAARGFVPGKERESRGGRDDSDDDRRPDESSRRPPPRDTRPPSSSGRTSGRTNGRTFHLTPPMRDYLDGEGLLNPQGLSETEKAKRDRLIRAWDKGTREMNRGAGR